MNSMEKSVAPKMWVKASRVKKRANHGGKSAINAFDFSILVGTVIPSGLKRVTSIKEDLTKSITGTELTALVDANSTVAIL